MSEVPLYGGSSKNLKHLKDATNLILAINVLSSDNVFQETSARHRAVEPEQWLQRHPEAGSSWPSWPQASQMLGRDHAE